MYDSANVRVSGSVWDISANLSVPVISLHPDAVPLLDPGSLGRMMGLFHSFQPKEGNGLLPASACSAQSIPFHGAMFIYDPVGHRGVRCRRAVSGRCIRSVQRY